MGFDPADRPPEPDGPEREVQRLAQRHCLVHRLLDPRAVLRVHPRQEGRPRLADWLSLPLEDGVEALASGEPAASGIPLPDPETGRIQGELQALLTFFDLDLDLDLGRAPA